MNIKRFILTLFSYVGWWWEKITSDRTHISLGLTKGKFQLVKQNHDEFVVTTQENLDRLDKADMSAFINQALTTAIHGCNFIAFQSSDNDNQFIQFWTRRGWFQFDFYANDFNGLKQYHSSVLKTLRDNGLVNNWQKFPKIYRSSKTKEAWVVQANLGKDLVLANRISTAILSGIYKIKPEELIAKVG